MSEVFVYGTMLPGSRNHARLEQIGGEFIRDSLIGPGYRMAVQNRGHGDNRFDRSNPNHYVEPILVPDRTHRGMIHGSVFDVDNLDEFHRATGNARSTRFAQINGLHVLIRNPSAGDLIYRTDPCIHRFADGSTRFFDEATYIFSNEFNKLPSGPDPVLIGETGGGYLWQTQPNLLYLFDINSGSNRGRSSMMAELPDHRIVPAHTYAELH